MDAVINLAGESLARIPWNAGRKKRILDSRIKGTRLLVDALERNSITPKVMLSASAIGYYGDTASSDADENTVCGNGFLSNVCREWEQEAERARVRLNCRVSIMRIGIVLHPQGGILRQLLPIFKLGLGGRLGNGRQLMSWIALEDLVAAVELLLDNGSFDGPVNLVAPAPVTNAEFTQTLAAALKRPAFFHIPEILLKAVLGEFAEEMLLKSVGVLPNKLLRAGFSYRHEQLETALFPAT